MFLSRERKIYTLIFLLLSRHDQKLKKKKKSSNVIFEVYSISFQTFFVQAFKIVVDS